jgi:hypothetical protein
MTHANRSIQPDTRAALAGPQGSKTQGLRGGLALRFGGEWWFLGENGYSFEIWAFLTCLFSLTYRLPPRNLLILKGGF